MTEEPDETVRATERAIEAAREDERAKCAVHLSNILTRNRDEAREEGAAEERHACAQILLDEMSRVGKVPSMIHGSAMVARILDRGEVAGATAATRAVLQRAMVAAEAQSERLATILRAIEWGGEFRGCPSCPECDGVRPSFSDLIADTLRVQSGHVADCALAHALSGAGRS